MREDDPPLLSAARSLPREARNLLAGGLAGMLAKSVVAPLDRIKILYQVTSARFRLGDVPRVARSIVEKEGYAALWKGNAATMMRVFPYSGIQFMVFDHCKVHFLGERRRKTGGPGVVGGGGVGGGIGGAGSAREVAGGSGVGDARATRTISHRGTIGGEAFEKAGLTPVESLVSGMVAGTVSVLCTYPLDMARAQLAVLRKKKKPKSKIKPPGGIVGGGGAAAAAAASQSGGKKGIAYVLSRSFRRNGIPGLYRGIAPTVLGILPYSGVAFTINEQAKRQILHLTGRDPTTSERLRCGALSGLFAQTLAYPLEVTRRRMQTIGIVPTSGSESAAVNFAGVGAGERQPPNRPQPPQRQRTLQNAVRLKGAAGPSGADASTVVAGTGEVVSNEGAPSMVATMRRLLSEQGVRGFYKGVSMNWVKGPIAFSISFTVFDTLQGWLRSPEGEEGRGGSPIGGERDGRLESGGSEASISRRVTNRLTNNEDGD